MSLLSQALKGSATIAASEAVSQLCGLARNIVLARLLTKSDFGIAVTLGMTVSLMEIGGRLSIEQFIVQSEDGDSPRLMAAAHMIEVALGIVSGTLIFFCARPLAGLFEIPDAAWALQAVALAPVLRSLSHLDVWRMTREMRFLPLAGIEVVTQVLITVAILPLALWRQSYAVLLWLLLGRQLIGTAASHWMAQRPYRWAFEKRQLDAIFRFGWPMLVGGLTVFATTQGDRMVVGAWYRIADLGLYGAAGMLTSVPAFTLLKVSGLVMLPMLSEVKSTLPVFRERLRWVSQAMALLASAFAVVMIVGGGSLLALVFGPRYAGAGTLVAWLSIAQAIRLLRNVPTVPALAKGDTGNIMVSNLLRISGVALSVPPAIWGKPMSVVAMAAAAGEFISLLGSSARLSRRQNIPLRDHLKPMAFAAAAIAVASLVALLGIQNATAWSGLPVAFVMALAAVLIFLHLFPDFRRKLQSALPRAVQPLVSKFAGQVPETHPRPGSLIIEP